MSIFSCSTVNECVFPTCSTFKRFQTYLGHNAPLILFFLAQIGGCRHLGSHKFSQETRWWCPILARFVRSKMAIPKCCHHLGYHKILQDQRWWYLGEQVGGTSSGASHSAMWLCYDTLRHHDTHFETSALVTRGAKNRKLLGCAMVDLGSQAIHILCCLQMKNVITQASCLDTNFHMHECNWVNFFSNNQFTHVLFNIWTALARQWIYNIEVKLARGS